MELGKAFLFWSVMQRWISALTLFGITLQQWDVS